MPITPFLEVPKTDRYWLCNAQVPRSLLAAGLGRSASIAQSSLEVDRADLVLVDLEVNDGRLLSVRSPTANLETDLGEADLGDVPAIDVKSGLVWPCLVDMHTHLDKGHIWPRSPNIDGTFEQALAAVQSDSQQWWNAEDVYRRAEFGLKCSYAHGTQAIRTHLDAFDEQGEISFGVFRQLRQEWADRIQLQAVCLVSLDYFLTSKGEKLADLTAAYGGVLGGVTYMNAEIVQQIDRTFDLAKERELDLDFHTDESLNPDDRALRLVAEAAVRHEFPGRITCGHCCSLSVQSDREVEETIAAVKAAGISIVSLPMCNLYLQDRRQGQGSRRTPQYRGMTLLKELKAVGVKCAIASDNCRDPFHAYGDHDGLEVFTQSVKIGQLDQPIEDWPSAITQTPAEMMGLNGVGKIVEGGSADFVVFKARSFNELIARGQGDRVVIRRGKQIDTSLPDYAELDDLMGLVG
ncbi:cytosine deaminase [cf. Phormidesmis sp. LEGE 11477]|uniref:cytosine deaminase n=1 Tax=cf. Phormidesmis sp. LEGE 11477 TaxID=1828680 RepID=UPI00187DE4D3|nr:cytosine deaminase [cf. Phormidesmis sp. LEGE 11477]MBE9061626.1 cytosine deaminase [cf. Phormidesmis sp. LEGE 11477]